MLELGEIGIFNLFDKIIRRKISAQTKFGERDRRNVVCDLGVIKKRVVKYPQVLALEYVPDCKILFDQSCYVVPLVFEELVHGHLT